MGWFDILIGFLKDYKTSLHSLFLKKIIPKLCKNLQNLEKHLTKINKNS